MNYFEKILYMLQVEMSEPQAYGWFHLMWIVLTIIAIIILFKKRKKYNNKQLKTVLGIYGIVALILEITKQIMWSFNYDVTTNIVTWDYQWYAAPFQLCTTPIYVSVICLFLKDNKIRKALLSYMAFVTILGGFMTILIPDDCLVSDIVINIHTMWLHCGSFVVSVYLMMSGAVKIDKQSLKSAIKVFVIFVLLAELLNVTIYNSGILREETFNMFYISPYFISTLPIFDVIQQNVPFLLYLLIYIFALSMGATIIYGIAYGIKKINNKIKVKEDNNDIMKEKKQELLI